MTNTDIHSTATATNDDRSITVSADQNENIGSSSANLADITPSNAAESIPADQVEAADIASIPADDQDKDEAVVGMTTANNVDGMSDEEIEAAIPGQLSCIDKATECEAAASAVYEADTPIASGEKEVWRRIYAALALAYAFYLAYFGAADYDNYLRSRGVDPDPRRASTFNPLLKAVFGLGKKGAIKASDKLKGRMRKRISMMASALELAELRAKRDANGNIDIVEFLEGAVDAEGRSGLEAARAEMARIRKPQKSQDTVSAKFTAGLTKLLESASSEPSVTGPSPVLLAVHAENGKLVFLGEVTGGDAGKLLTQFIENSGNGDDPLSGTAMGELVGHLSFARGLGTVDHMVRIDVTDTGVQVQAALASTETVIGQCFIAGSSLLSPGTYWLDKTAAAKIASISRFAKHGAGFEIHLPQVLSDRTRVAISANSIQTAVNSYNDARRERNPSEYKEFNLDKLLGTVECNTAQLTDRAQLLRELQMPTIAEIAYPEDWQWLGETALDEDTRKWVTKTMNTTGDNEVAKAVHAGADGNQVSVRIENDGFHILDGLRERTVITRTFQSPIDGEPVQADYRFRSKDLPGALSAIKGVLPDAPIVMSIAEKAIRLRAEQDGSVAEFLIPTLIEGTRYPKAAKIAGFVTADEPHDEQEAA